MIGYLRGKALAISPEKLTLDAGGVGYDVHISLSTFAEVEQAGSENTMGLFIHTHVRQDALELFGFWTERERSLFERLIAVGGIGPRLARVILSGMSAGDLVATIAAGDSARLTSIPGVGKRTAERMVVELKDRVGELAPDAALPPAIRPEDDLVGALINLGYRAPEAQKAVARARQEDPDGAFEDLIRSSLRFLARA